MAKLTTTDLTSLTSNEASAVSAINANFAAVETAMELTLTRTGTSPNAMESDLDMNNFDILNANVGNFANLLVGGEEISGAQDVFKTIAVAGQSNVVADSATDTLTFAAGANVTITTNAATDTVTIAASPPPSSLSDGDYGDIVVSGTGSVMTIDAGVIVNDDVNASAAIAATKIADGTVSNVEFQYIGSLSSNAQTQLDAKQPLDSDLTTIAGLTATTDSFLQAKASAWAARTIAQVKTDLGIPATESFIVACSDETTALTAGVAKATFRMPYAFTITDVRASVTTAPTGASLLTVDVNDSGTTVLSTKLTFDASEKTTTTAATPRVISDTALADDAEITVDIDQIGSTVAGAGLKVYIIGTRT